MRIWDTWLGHPQMCLVLTSRAAHTAALQTLQRLCAPAASESQGSPAFLSVLEGWGRKKIHRRGPRSSRWKTPRKPTAKGIHMHTKALFS